MKRFQSIVLILLNVNFLFGLEVNHLRVESLENPIGVEYESPRFSWWLQSEELDVAQTAYEIVILVEGKKVYGTGKLASNQNHLVQTEFKAEPKTRYYWQVRVWDNNGNKAESELAFFETGLFGDWKADWISVSYPEKERSKNPVQQYRKEFLIKEKVKSARIYATSCGLYQAYLNGGKIGDQEMTPGWTSYSKRLQYQVYDVSKQFKQGQNCLAFELADGWHRGRINYRGNKVDPFKERLALLCHLEIELESGKKLLIGTDKTWECKASNIQEATIYDGEVVVFPEIMENWKLPGKLKSWQKVITLDYGYKNLIASHSVPVKVIETLKPISQIDVDENSVIFDFGQNLVGRVNIEFKVFSKKSVYIKHAEVLAKDGSFYTENLRGAKAEVQLDGFVKSYEPKFTFMGFRYALVSGVNPNEILSIKAKVIHSDMKRTGFFECGDEHVNQLYSNIIWGQKGNFLDVPTDCPQRDERMGWTGDAQVFLTTAAYNYDVAAFFRKWMADMAADQYDDGSVPWVIPNVFPWKKAPATGWADAITIIPWSLYEIYGDEQVLRESYPAMKKWIDYMMKNSKDGLWFGEKHFGDWLSYNPDDDRDGEAAVTEKDLLAQIHFIHSINLLCKAAIILHYEDDLKVYSKAYASAKASFQDEFLTKNGRLVSGTQTAYTLALAYGLTHPYQQLYSVARLAENVKDYGHISTGFLGTPHISHVLSDFNHSELAYDLLFKDKYPSWLYPVKMGATTIWERWDGIKPDSTFQKASMNSFNHYAYGAIGSWLMEHSAGIQQDYSWTLSDDEPGFNKIHLAPEIDERMGYVKAQYNSSNGPIISHWVLKDDYLNYTFSIPVNSSAVISFPEGFSFISLAGTGKGNKVPINFLIEPKEGLKLGSGTYVLELARNSND